ncbi:MAG: GAF domain-containing protein, partial [Anaerolineales bacterium]|nr:GAF domain-containing protein [Anaerolineales bacterium]
HAAAFFLGSLLLWWLLRQPWPAFWGEASLGVLADGMLTPPFAILGSLIFWGSGMPVFVIFCVGVMVVSMLIWVAWQRQYTLTQHITQFAALNSVGTSLRETLDLSTVIERTQQQVNDLILADQFALWLRGEQGTWQNVAAVGGKRPFSPDDFTQWVADHGRILELNGRNIAFAPRHGLTIPQPPPQAWLGVPLTTAERLIGVMVLQRGQDGQRFSRWSRELFVAIANQASAAIQNARLYGETVRLYNLTDEALAQRVRQLQALLNSIQEGVLMLDRQGQVVLVNPMALTLLGSRLQPGDSLPTVAAVRLGYKEAELGQLVRQLTAVSTPPTVPETAVVYQTTLGATSRTIERSEAPVLSEDGQLLGWLMLFRDVTADHELAERRADLTRMIVHDLRNPITTILSNLNLASNQLPVPLSNAQELLDDARQASLDMLDMVDSLMDINRMEAGQAVIDPDAMSLGRLAQTVVERLQPLAQRQNICLRLELAVAIPPVWADEEMVRRVLVNLLDNALKFTPAGGEVVCRVEPAETAVEPVEAPHEPGARCLISDTGPGIPATIRELVFDRYMRTNQGGAQVRGTGLGLTFCKMTVEAHNGRIWVEESANGGSCFIFTLPGIPVFGNR